MTEIVKSNLFSILEGIPDEVRVGDLLGITQHSTNSEEPDTWANEYTHQFDEALSGFSLESQLRIRNGLKRMVKTTFTEPNNVRLGDLRKVFSSNQE